MGEAGVRPVSPLDLDDRPVFGVLELQFCEMRKGLRAQVRQHDPLRAELGSVRHQLPVRDVRGIVTVEVRGLADEEVRAAGDRYEVFAPARIPGVRDQRAFDVDAQAVRLRQAYMTDLESAHLRTAKLSRFLGENERPERNAGGSHMDRGVRARAVAERVAAPEESDSDGHAISLMATGRRSFSDRRAASAMRSASIPSRAVQRFSASPRANRRKCASSARYAASKRTKKVGYAGSLKRGASRSTEVTGVRGSSPMAIVSLEP